MDKILINKFNKQKHVSGQWNYMGVVSMLPALSPRHRLMETGHVQ